MAGEIVHLEIPSRSFERSAAFYAKLFGWRADGPQSGGHLLFEIPGVEPSEGGSAASGMTGSLVRSALAQATGPLPFVAVDDVDATLAEAERQGGRILVPRLSLAGRAQYALLADVDGNVIAVVAASGAGGAPKRAAATPKDTGKETGKKTPVALPGRAAKAPAKTAVSRKR